MILVRIIKIATCILSLPNVHLNVDEATTHTVHALLNHERHANAFITNIIREKEKATTKCFSLKKRNIDMYNEIVDNMSRITLAVMCLSSINQIDKRDQTPQTRPRRLVHLH